MDLCFKASTLALSPCLKGRKLLDADDHTFIHYSGIGPQPGVLPSPAGIHLGPKQPQLPGAPGSSSP